MLLQSICMLSILFNVSFQCNTKNLEVQRKLSVHEGKTSDLKTSRQDEERIFKHRYNFLNITNSSSNEVTDSNLIFDYITDSPPVLNLNKFHNWGGNCTDLHWENCSMVTEWGGNYSYSDKRYPTKKIEGYHMIDCNSTKEINRIVCLRNGWTVSRCNLLCMARCNKNLLRYWNRYVSHDGECGQNEKSDEFMDLECKVKKLTLFKKLGCPSKKAECEEKKLNFILEQLGCQPTDDALNTDVLQ